ncbi:hypothetical protein A2U01_0086696, partial [Trifolium medium]|nr:hypothetical protein [Trifolium medium]
KRAKPINKHRALRQLPCAPRKRQWPQPLLYARPRVASPRAARRAKSRTTPAS